VDVEKQVLVIWAATNGYTDDVAVEDVRQFESGLLKFVESSHPGVLAAIAEKKAITDEIKKDLKQLLEDFKDEWRKRSASEDGYAAAPVTRATAAAAPQPA
jgi:F-type H+-transporting ATPase subunit alpha